MSVLVNPGITREKSWWHEYRVALAVVTLPLLTILLFATVPAFAVSFEDHWFHFEIVTFVSLVALVLGVTILVLLDSVTDARALFIPLGLSGIAGVFLIHGLATPGVVEIASEHAGHDPTSVSLFVRPDLAVTWSAPISLVVGACFFALASAGWSESARAWLSTRRRQLLWLCALLYLAYVVIAVAFPGAFLILAQMSPGTRFFLAAIAGVLYFGAAWRFWNRYRATHERLDAGLALAAVLLGEALIPMTLLPTWSSGWWLYHVLMLAAFCLALGAVVMEYERARHFQLTTYFAAVSVIVTVLLSLVAGDLMERLVAPLLPDSAVNLVRWGATGIFMGIAAFMFCALALVVRRGDMLLRENSLRLQAQQAALERGRLAEALVPIGVAIGASLDLDQVLGVICRESHRLFRVNTALVWYKEGEELVARAAYGENSQGFLGMRQPILNNSLLGARVVRERRPLFVNHAQTSNGVSAEIVDRFGIKSVLGVPFLKDNEALGALVLIDTQNGERFGDLDLDVARIFGQQATQALTHVHLYATISSQADALQQALGELSAGYNQTLDALSAALDARDRETEGHSRRVAAYALLLANAMNIRDESTRQAIEWGALLHDVGKIGVPDAILHKPASLTPEEWRLMHRHPDIGYQILQSIPALQPAFAIVRHHHERWDGQGYPLRLTGLDIPLPARIFAIADTLDAMTTDRPYRTARTFAEAQAEITRQRGIQFDPEVVDAFAPISEQAWKQTAESVKRAPVQTEGTTVA